ncbi:XRE family transcriptional regulator [Streptomyces pacificus]|uniref:XRE family transcriptional regulator n=1 Tax=Streptomyces pacificus TaxID=2705029 RepID=A0A6A0ATQ6_9ACTN|nr:XRE family transcriptional regulator [Streptomyces pacificus]GFH36068.1 XRE family transcriptional regulator [Streptomyces pacificus]
MPRWKTLPEELDPQVREFASQLRRLVDRSGLSIAALSDRTGYSKTSWERFLNGRLLAPKGAIVALAEVTGTNPIHLTTMWELAERAWSRAEMRHDMTMEAIRISQARAALGEPGPSGPGAPSGRGAAGLTTAAPGGGGHRDRLRVPAQPSSGSGRAGHRSGSPRTDAPASSGGPGRGRGRRGPTVFLAGLVGALLVIAAAVLLTDLGGTGDEPGADVAKSPSASPTTSAPVLPVGVKCFGADCTGQDPESMGCGGQFATTASRATVGTAVVEVRYSSTCGAAWARITQAAPGDKVRISAGDENGDGLVNADKDAYTPMVAVAAESEAKACATLAAGDEGCTREQ